jgi:transcription-repair coupling factor (superfamily II helicase)
LLKNILHRLFKTPQFVQAAQLAKQRPYTTIAGLKGSSLSFLAEFFVQTDFHSLLVITADDEKAEEIWGDWSAIHEKDDVLNYPARMPTNHSIRSDNEKTGLQLHAINQILESTEISLVTTISALAEQIPQAQNFYEQRVALKTGEPCPLEFLVERLVCFGYERADLVSGVGEFSIRGGLVDVFAYESMSPVRIEFFGDIVETIRTFNIVTQRSKEKIENFVILPPPDQSNIVIGEAGNCLLDLLPEDTLLLLDEPERHEGTLARSLARLETFQEDNNPNESKIELMWERLEIRLSRLKRIEHRHLGIDEIDLHFGMLDSKNYRGNIRELREDFLVFQNDVIASNTHPNMYLLLEENFEIERMTELLNEDDNGYMKIGKAVIHSGFKFPNAGIMLVTEKDLFGRIPRRRNWGKYRGGVPISKVKALSYGDLVVHIDHGVGRYIGLEKIMVAGSEKECLKIQYRDGDLLFVNIEHLWRVSKHTGSEGTAPQLNRLGGKDWERLKKKAQKSIEKMAKELLHLYAVRKAEKGFAFSPDHIWQRELEASFLYDETPDQLRTIVEVKKDMESTAPMDRLICGDVGFGKTEVALRAAFKAVLDEKQVAILVPTTVLAQQHYNTFSERLAAYPVEAGLLSRFRTKGEQKETVDGLKRGRVDIVIGTHRLISKDVEFRNLGLLVIDEEHRFGVGQKERLKSKYKLIDVLSLTATPIPRTLHFSLAGSREMSIINTPPEERLPIIAQVSVFDKKLIKQAILEEVYRGGQVFIVHNSVRSIYSMEGLIKKMLPHIRVAVAHGQMSSYQLEKVMTEFLEKKYDCLVCTMIIEAGLDLPNVNTLIVNRADKLGLAQLYQIKGRVGRSNRQAFAYFLVPPFKYLSPGAMRRLQTIEEHLELGAGLQIAMKDLEIRGAGNLLGSEQSGFMNAIGFDLYCKLLEETVAKLKGEETTEREKQRLFDVTVDADFDSYIPDSYVQIDFERVNIYQRLTAVESDSEITDLAAELRDRFGPLPKQLRVLLEIARLRVLCALLGIEKLRIKNGELSAYFSNTYYNSARKELLQKLIRSIQESSQEMMRFLQGDKFGFKFRLHHSGESCLRFTREFFSKLLKEAA